MNRKQVRLVTVSVLYYPDEKSIENIGKYIDFMDKLILWDNTPIQHQHKLDITSFESNKIICMTDGENRGTAYVYNKAAKWGIENGYDYLLLMDQDSTWKNFNEYKKSAIAFLSANPNVIITPNINAKIHSTIQEVSMCISSGMFLSLATYLKIGNYEEKLFVEGVDVDYCLRARQINIKIIPILEGILYQQFGRLTYSKLFRCYTRNDSADRTYNIVLNHILIIKKYKKVLKMSEISSFIYNYMIARFVKILLLEDNKIKKCNMLMKACLSGIFKSIY